MLIYKIFRAHEWADFQAKGVTEGAPIDVADGYIHFSTASQAAETAAKHFADEDRLVLLAVEAEPLETDLKWELSLSGAEFPHLYRALRVEDILWSAPLPLEDGAHRFPGEMTA
ncbi:MAG: DUF952 domain-containing protein [Rhodobacteraceae bacterium]|nr:DUF952 domain-containing protein [Paracoccaceae bacterium]